MATLTLLISGLLPYDSGKTYFSVSLARSLRALGLDVAAFKPVAGHSLWYQFRVFAESLRLGVLVGEDVLKYMRLGLITNPDVQNPIDILTAVPDVSTFRDVDDYLRSLEDITSQAVLVRVSVGGTRRYFLVNEVLRKLPAHLREEVIKSLDVFKPVTRVNVLWLLNYLMSMEADLAISSAAKSVLSMGDAVIIESFNNALTPVSSIAYLVNALAVVAPGKALIYSGSKLRSYISTVRSLRELESRRFVKLYKPDMEIEVPLTEDWPPKRLPEEVVKSILTLR